MAHGSDPTAKFFRCTDRERAAFEAGIKLGAIYHQFVGTAVSRSSAASLERAIEGATRSQPHVVSVRARIDRRRLQRSRGPYRYTSLTGEMFDVTVVTRVGHATATGRLRNIAGLEYPLMWVTLAGR